MREAKFFNELYVRMTRAKYVKNDVIENALRALSGHEAANHSAVHKTMIRVIR